MKNNENSLIVRLLRKVEFTVFCVDADQKRYWDKQFGVMLPYSSGQQIKKSFMSMLLKCLNASHAPLTFNFLANNKTEKLEQKEITQPCDPTYFDQLLGGWMSTPSKKGGKDEEDESSDVDKNQYKRRSPFSISAMTAVHPLLASLIKEANMTFDRTDVSNDKIVVKNEKGKELNPEEITAFLDKCNKRISKRNMISGKDRANGFFKTDFVIDLRKLFRIPVILYDVEVSQETIAKLKKDGWIEFEDETGKWLELPKRFHDELAEAIAWSIVNWKITSNQSRTYDPMPVLSIAVSKRSDEIVNAIRGEIEEVNGDIKGRLVVDNKYPNTKVYSTNLLKGYLVDAETSYTAIDDAVMQIKNEILAYYNSKKEEKEIEL